MVRVALFHRTLAIYGLVAALSLGSLITAAAAQDASTPLKWKYKSGSGFKEVEAEFVSLSDAGVVLRAAGGREATLKLSLLSIESHYQALKLANPEEFSKPLAKAPVVSAVAEPEFEVDADAITDSPFPEDPTLEQFLEIIKAESEAKNPLLAWHILPPKMQSDMEDVVVTAVDKAGRSLVTQIRSLLRNLNTIVQEKHDFIANNPHVASQPQVVAMVDPHWPKIAGLMGALSDKKHWQFSNFKKGNVVPWMATLAADTFPHATALGESAKPFLPPEAQQQMNAGEDIDYKIISESGGRGKIELTIGGLPPQELDVQKLGNIWIVPAWMNELRTQVDQAKITVDGLDPAVFTMAQGVLVGVNAIAGQLAGAESQAEFDKAIDELANFAQSMVPQGGPGGFGGPPQF